MELNLWHHSLTRCQWSQVDKCFNFSKERLQWVFSYEFRIEWALLIWCPKLFPCYLQMVDFFPTPSNHHHFLQKNHQFSCDPFLERHISISADALTKCVPLSDMIILTIPLCPVKCLRFKMNKSVLNVLWICIAILERQVYKAPYSLIKHHIP